MDGAEAARTLALSINRSPPRPRGCLRTKFKRALRRHLFRCTISVVRVSLLHLYSRIDGFARLRLLFIVSTALTYVGAPSSQHCLTISSPLTPSHSATHVTHRKYVRYRYACENVNKLLVGNKSDLEAKRAVTTEEAKVRERAGSAKGAQERER